MFLHVMTRTNDMSHTQSKITRNRQDVTKLAKIAASVLHWFYFIFLFFWILFWTLSGMETLQIVRIARNAVPYVHVGCTALIWVELYKVLQHSNDFTWHSLGANLNGMKSQHSLGIQSFDGTAREHSATIRTQISQVSPLGDPRIYSTHKTRG